MKSIIKIEEYLPESNQIIVKFARLHAPQSIDEYNPVTVDCDKLDCYNTETFLHTFFLVSLMESLDSTLETKRPAAALNFLSQQNKPQVGVSSEGQLWTLSKFK